MSFALHLSYPRLKYSLAESHGCFLRVSYVSAETFFVEIEPYVVSLKPVAAKTTYYPIENADLIMDCSRVLRGILYPMHSQSFYLNKAGDVEKAILNDDP